MGTVAEEQLRQTHQDGSVATFVCYRDGGFSELISLVISFVSTDGQERYFPPAGFVGLDSSSIVVSGQRPYRLNSIRLHQRLHTRNVPPWRLICEWVLPPPAPPLTSFGSFSGIAGR